MQATLVHVRDPFRHHVDRTAHRVSRRVRIDTLLRQHGLITGRGRGMRRLSGFVVATGPNEYLLESQWSRCVRDGELITIVALPKGGGGLRTIALLAVAVAAAWVTGGASIAGTATLTGGWAVAAGAAVSIAGAMLVNAVLPVPKAPSGSNDSTSGAYGIGANSNTARLLQSIPVLYGRFNVTPDYAAQPYSEFSNYQQTLYSLLAITQGEATDFKITIGDTLIDTFTEVDYEIIPPGGTVTLFPDNVVTSDAVQGLELKRPSEGGDWVGPYVANPAGSTTSEIHVDIGFAQGIYRVNSDGKEKTAIAQFEVQVQLVDDAGNAAGAWTSALAKRIERDDRTAGQYDTYALTVPEGRYQVRAKGFDTDQGGGTTVNAISWVGMRAYLPSKRTYGDITLLAVRIRATNILNSSTAKAISVTATRMLPVWNGASWSAPQATRSIAWAAADVIRNTTYGRGFTDNNRLNLEELLRLDQTWTARGDNFDAYFDTKTSVWDALTTVCRAGRAIPMYYAGVIDIVRDEPRDVATLMLSPDNIVADSFAIDYAFPTQDSPDHVVVTYRDETTWTDQTVTCALGGSPQLNPKNVTLVGVTNRDHAFREGIYMAACNRDQRKMPSLTTEMDGYIARYGDLVTVSHDVPAWGESGVILGLDDATGTLTTSEPLQWFVASQHYIQLRARNGSRQGPFVVTQGATAYEAVLQGLTDAQYDALQITDGTSAEPTGYQFGPAAKQSQDCIVLKAKPDGTGKVALSLVNYALSVHLAENDVNTPPPGSGSLLLEQPAAPSVGGVGVKQDSDSQTVWLYVDPVAGAVAYEFQISYDGGVTWISVGVSPSNSIQARIPGGTWIVRARAIGRLGIAGPWNQSQVDVSGAPPVIGNLANLMATALTMGILITWQLPDRLHLIGADAVEIWFGTTDDRSRASQLATVSLPSNSYTLSNLHAGDSFLFWARIRGTDTGNYGPELGPVRGTSSVDAEQLLGYLTGQISRTQLAQDLLSDIDTASGVADEVQQQAQEILKNAQDIAAEALRAGNAETGLGSYITNVESTANDAATKVGQLATRTTAAESNITTLQQTTGQQATQLTQLNTTVGQHTTTISTLSQTQQDQANQLNELEVTSGLPVKAGADTTKAGANTRKAGIYTYSVARVDGDLAEAVKTETLAATVGVNTASIQNISQAQVSGDMALASRIDTVTASLAGNTAAVQAVADAQVSLNGRVSSSYVVKTGISVGGVPYAAGFAVGVDYSGGTVSSQFLVNASTFAIIDASAAATVSVYPFVVQGGQTFINQALIGTGWITNAMIGNKIASTTTRPSDGLPRWEWNKDGGNVTRGDEFTMSQHPDYGIHMTAVATGVLFIEFGKLP